MRKSFIGIALLCAFSVSPLLASAETFDLSWRTINSQLISNGGDANPADLSKFIIEAQPCATNGQIPQLTFDYNNGDKDDKEVIFPKEYLDGDTTNIADSVLLTDGKITITKMYRRYCVKEAKESSDPKPAVRIRLASQNVSEAKVIGSPAPIVTKTNETPTTNVTANQNNAGAPANTTTTNSDNLGKAGNANGDNLGKAGNANGDNLGGGKAADTGLITTEAGVIALINKIINWMFTIFISVAIIMFIYAAFIYLTSGGGEEVGKAHKIMLYGAIAVAVATLSKGLVSLVQSFVKS